MIEVIQNGNNVNTETKETLKRGRSEYFEDSLNINNNQKAASLGLGSEESEVGEWAITRRLARLRWRKP